jgi:multimeric flavodoxin WrbA
MAVVLGILGSPHRNGNTAILLESFLTGAREAGAETIRIDVTDMSIVGCRACDDCQDTGECVVDDDMQIIYDAIARADVLVLATPLYFSGMSSQLKAVIDRCQCLWHMARRKKAAARTGYLLAVGARKNADFKNVLSEVRSFYMGVGITFLGQVTVPGVESQGDISIRTEELAKAYGLGRLAAIGPTADTH